MKLIFISEGYRMYRRHLKVRRSGFKRYDGNAKEICRKIVDACWNEKKRYFMVSPGHFRQFYTRDFCWCTGPLLAMGYSHKVKQTLKYALEIFKRHGTVTTSISPKGVPFDFPTFAVDSLPYLVRSLKLLGSRELIDEYKDFLAKQARDHYFRVIDLYTGLVRADRTFSSMKDHADRRSSCYDNCMVGMLSKDLKEMRLHNPYREYDYKRLVKFNFWNGEAFIDELDSRVISGDANLFPFWTGLFDEEKMLRSSIESIRGEGLDKPFPLKYTSHMKERLSMPLLSTFAQDYENSSIWMHLGPIYVRLVAKIDKKLAAGYLDSYKRQIESYGTFLEVFDREGKPYRTRFYTTDEAMLWAAMLFDLLK